MKKNRLENCFPITVTIYKETTYLYNDHKPFVTIDNLKACELDSKYMKKESTRNLYFENNDRLYEYYKDYLRNTLNKDIEVSYDWKTHQPIIRFWDIRLHKYLESEIRVKEQSQVTLNSLNDFLIFRDDIRRNLVNEFFRRIRTYL